MSLYDFVPDGWALGPGGQPQPSALSLGDCATLLLEAHRRAPADTGPTTNAFELGGRRCDAVTAAVVLSQRGWTIEPSLVALAWTYACDEYEEDRRLGALVPSPAEAWGFRSHDAAPGSPGEAPAPATTPSGPSAEP